MNIYGGKGSCMLVIHLTFSKQALFFTCLHYKSFENTVGKGEIVRNEQFVLFSQLLYPKKRKKQKSENLYFKSSNFLLKIRISCLRDTVYLWLDFHETCTVCLIYPLNPIYLKKKIGQSGVGGGGVGQSNRISHFSPNSCINKFYTVLAL